jgi:hypothetical protein
MHHVGMRVIFDEAADRDVFFRAGLAHPLDGGCKAVAKPAQIHEIHLLTSFILLDSTRSDNNFLRNFAIIR